jgi:anti-sigma factor RsiW
MPHVDDGSLHAYLDGELSGADRERVASHLTECAACRTRLEEERALIARAGALLGRVVPPEREPAAFSQIGRRPRPAVPVQLAWAATVALAFAIGWYLQGARLARDLARQATTSPPPPSGTPAPVAQLPPARPRGSEADARAASPAKRARPVAPVPAQSAAAEPQHEEAAGRMAPAARAPQPAAKAMALEDATVPWPPLDAARAQALLGRPPALIPGRPVRRLASSPVDAGLVIVEQEWQPGVLVRLYERRAMVTAAPARDRVSRADDAARAAAPNANAAPEREALARYVGSLRVEIAGPLGADSLSRVLDTVE